MLMIQYIEYWEFFAKFIGDGYSKIIDVNCDGEKYSVFKTDLENILKELK